jgi:hypothetical protein
MSYFGWIRYSIFLPCTSVLTYLLMEQSPSGEADWLSAGQEIPRIYSQRNVLCHILKSLPPVHILSQINPVHTPNSTSWKSILILSSHLRLGLPWFPSLRVPHQNPVDTSSLPQTYYMLRPSHSFRFDHPNNIWRGLQIIELLIMQFPPLPFTSSLSGLNTFLSTLSPHNLSLCFSLSVSDQVSHPYKIIGKIIVLSILIFIFWVANWKTKDSAPNYSKHSLTSTVYIFTSHYIHCVSGASFPAILALSASIWAPYE